MINVALIGSTGSIGRQVCNVVRRYPDLFRLSALVANTNGKLLFEQAAEFQPKRAILLKSELLAGMPPSIGVTALQTGEQNALDCIDEADVVFVAATGFAGLKYSLRAIESRKKLALANKETLVCGGELVMRKVKEYGIDLIPVDSEHSALWQALHFNRHGEYEKLLLTASGGPFYGYTKEQLEKVTVKDALKHPTWSMGAKITIDSATLLNKGFEVIEAKWLYDAPFDKIEAVVQPESIIHSMVQFSDGAVLAQMSYPTMELPIQLALTYPKRLDCGLKRMDFAALGNIRFLPLRRKDFPCFDLALSAGEAGMGYPCALNAAGEEGVRAFLQERIKFTQIAEVMEQTLQNCPFAGERADDYQALRALDLRARQEAQRIIDKW
ncbi:MAG: 1-deoxy-D-xylulose-5-phosphate reductoisomerase [Clostridia bacterium]|nr:1-deoxy-D-xylulose-5-phosphate reductoisomerase [Clostridia bacterium]